MKSERDRAEGLRNPGLTSFIAVRTEKALGWGIRERSFEFRDWISDLSRHSANQHAIAVTKKPVSFSDGLTVGFENEFATGERGNQH